MALPEALDKKDLSASSLPCPPANGAAAGQARSLVPTVCAELILLLLTELVAPRYNSSHFTDERTEVERSKTHP